MTLRRVSLLALAVLAGCPSVDRQDQPARIAVASFDPNTATLPQPNDLSLQRAPGVPAGVQRELLFSFIANGGFPADQESAITIPIQVKERQGDGGYGVPCGPVVPACGRQTSRCGTAPAGLDLDTVNDDAIALYRVDGATPARVPRCAAAPFTAECYEPAFANGSLTLRRNGPDGSRRWAAGSRYTVALRAGRVKTADGLTVGPDTTIALATSGMNLAVAENQPPGGIPDSNCSGSNADEVASLEALRGVYSTPRAWGAVTDAATCTAALAAPATVPLCWLPAPSTTATAPFAVVAQAFPSSEIAAIQTFGVQPAAATRPLTDTGSGQLPLPSDFLLDPATGKVRNVPAFGPAAAGLATLDGFSTTAPLLIPLSGPVRASSISKTTLRVYKLGTFAADGTFTPLATPLPQNQLRDQSDLALGQSAQIVTQPSTAVVNGASTSLVLAPAVPIPNPPPPATPTSFIPVPPLDERSQYLVVATNGVLAADGTPLRRSTLMDLVFSFTGDLCVPAGSATCTSQIPGVANADAAGLQQLRTSLKPVLQALSLDSCANNATCAVLAYTVKTQSVKDVTKLLSAAPYGVEKAATAAVFSPIAAAGAPDFDTGTVGVTFAGNFPNVAKFVQATIPTVYAIQGSTGAFDPAFATWTPAQVQQNIRAIPALVAVPRLASTCTPTAPCPAPLVVFNHGINGARHQMIPLADALAARGFVVAAIDMPYHGDRALCAANSDCAVAGGGDGVCTPSAALQTPSDTTAPGTCTTGTLRFRPERLSTVASGKFFITSNFFRIRDGLRQNALDQSALVLALARPPQAAYPLQPAANPLRDALLAQGVVVDPTRVYFSGISLGSMAGTSVVATNPRFSRAGLYATGGTLVDVFTTSPGYQAALAAVFAPLGVDLPCVQTGTGCDAATRAAQTARYAQTLAIAKWILDPADPLNYVAHLAPSGQKTFDPALQPFVAGGLGSATTQTYGQVVVNDDTVPNPYTLLELGLGAIPSNSYASASGRPTSPGLNLSLHELLYADFPPGTPSTSTAGGIVRDDLASFLATGTATPGAKNVP